MRQGLIHLLLLISIFCASTLQAQESMAEFEPDSRQQLRIIALAPHIVESLYAIGAGEQIIATTEYADYPQAANAIPRVGNYARLQIEEIIALQPDVIISWENGNPADDLARLRQYSIRMVDSHAVNLADVAIELRFLGKLTGREKQAELLAADYENRLTQLKDQYATESKVSVFYELWSRPLRTVSGDDWPQQQLEVCGASNAFQAISEPYPQVSLEKVLVMNPQMIIQPSSHSQSSPDAINWQQWPHLTAVQNNAILHPNADKMHRITTRMLDELEVLCKGIDQARQNP